MCTGSHSIRSPLNQFVADLLSKMYSSTSYNVLAKTYNKVISPSVMASINGISYDYDTLLPYYEAQRARYRDFALSRDPAIECPTDDDTVGQNRAGVVGAYHTYTATRADTGRKVMGRLILMAEVVPENEGISPIEHDPRTVWKWDLVRHEFEGAS